MILQRRITSFSSFYGTLQRRFRPDDVSTTKRCRRANQTQGHSGQSCRASCIRVKLNKSMNTMCILSIISRNTLPFTCIVIIFCCAAVVLIINPIFIIPTTTTHKQHCDFKLNDSSLNQNNNSAII